MTKEQELALLNARDEVLFFERRLDEARAAYRRVMERVGAVGGKHEIRILPAVEVEGKEGGENGGAR